MGGKRKISELKLKSVWDEALLREALPNPKHRSKLWKWLIQHPDITDLNKVPFETWQVPRDGYTKVRNDFSYFTTKIVECNESARKDTTKLLIELQDGHRVETVVMIHYKHSTVCVSSQIGCQMGCRFCATGTMGIIGDLTAGEIAEQLVRANSVSRIRNVVFMGMGEPLQNYENVKMALEMMIDEKIFGLSPRHITVSTVGVLKNMYRFTNDMPHVNLALSLHAPNQQVRLKIVPTASAAKIDALMEAVDNHIKGYIAAASEGRKRSVQKGPSASANTGTIAIEDNSNSSNQIISNDDEIEKNTIDTNNDSNNSNTNSNNNNNNNDNFNSSSNSSVTDEPSADRIAGVDVQEFSVSNDLTFQGFRPSKLTGVMIEYILIKDVNDRPEHAHELGRLLQSRRDYILLNLIPYNPTEVAEDYHPPTEEAVLEFFEICRSKPYMIYTRIRQEMGQDVAAACGQLALVHDRRGKEGGGDIEESVSRKIQAQRGKGKATSASSSSSKGGCSSNGDCQDCDSKPTVSLAWRAALTLSLPALAAALQFLKK